MRGGGAPFTRLTGCRLYYSPTSPASALVALASRYSSSPPGGTVRLWDSLVRSPPLDPCCNRSIPFRSCLHSCLVPDIIAPIFPDGPSICLDVAIAVSCSSKMPLDRLGCNSKMVNLCWRGIALALNQRRVPSLIISLLASTA